MGTMREGQLKMLVCCFLSTCLCLGNISDEMGSDLSGTDWQKKLVRVGEAEHKGDKTSTQKGKGSWQRLLEKQSEQKEKKNEDSEEF